VGAAGEGVVDFKAILAKAREICPPLAVFIKPITGRPPAILPVWDTEFMKKYADARAADFARFLALAKKGGPYERPMVTEDVPGKTAEALTAALTYQQREHMERAWSTAKRCWTWACGGAAEVAERSARRNRSRPRGYPVAAPLGG